MENVALAVMLCAQKLDPNSMWQPYINVLPKHFDTPLFFPVYLLESLRPSPVFEESLLLFRNVARQFVHFLLEIICADEFRLKKKKDDEPTYLNSPFTAANFTFDLYRWSVACVSTRINMIPSDLVKDQRGKPVMIPALIPFLDMANHQLLAENVSKSVHFSEEDCAEIIAVHDYKHSEPVTIFYGWRSSSEFLLHNGFVPEGKNIRDVYKLRIGLPKTKREEVRLDLIHKLGFSIASNVFVFELKIVEPCIPESLVQFARIYVMDEVVSVKQAKKIINSDENIQKAWRFLRDRFALFLRAYREKITDITDSTMVMSVTPRSLGAIQQHYIPRLKSSEMEILRKAEDLCNTKLENL
ncbi:unnamed protein product [Gongylonema pulchrum]|uniref:protein-histidine N-methyltransferase n=1 Tax=Gongylonema pulchrum TaxID=637853 RepID=A0A183CX99_9BILA|nr:unnamed protein product [Gongylonema pulchrum]